MVFIQKCYCSKSNFKLIFLGNTDLEKDKLFFSVCCGQYQTILDYANGRGVFNDSLEKITNREHKDYVEILKGLNIQL